MNKSIKSISTFVVVFCLALSGCNNEEDKRKIAYLESRLSELENGQQADASSSSEEDTYSDYSSSSSSFSSSRNSEPRKKQFVGTYRVVDNQNITWIITLNKDGTVTVNEKGSNDVKCGSWYDSPYDGPCLDFTYDDWTYMEFPQGREDIYMSVIADGYLYSSNINYKAKNPKYRLPIKKIK